jgi:hypothetical protein
MDERERLSIFLVQEHPFHDFYSALLAPQPCKVAEMKAVGPEQPGRDDREAIGVFRDVHDFGNRLQNRLTRVDFESPTFGL